MSTPDAAAKKRGVVPTSALRRCLLLLLAAPAACHGSPLQLSRVDGATSDRSDGDVGDAQDASDGSPGRPDGPCQLLCPASSTSVMLSGSVSVPAGDGAPLDVDSLILTVCLDDLCATLPRVPGSDGQAPMGACGNAGSGCTPAIFGGSGTIGTQYATVAVTQVGRDLYSVVGSVAFPLAREATVAAHATRLSLRAGDATLLDVTAGGCAIARGCCGNLPYQSCALTW